MERIKLIDTIEDLQTFIREYSPDESPQGIFMLYEEWQHDMEEKPLPWLDENTAYSLDMEYYLHRSGDKEISIMYKRYLGIEDAPITSIGIKDLLMKTIVKKFSLSWNKIWDALTTNYRPLENYDMEQTETPDITKERNTKSNTKITNTNEIDSSQQNVFGFNSSDAVPSTSQEGKNTTTTEGNEDDNNTWEEETETGIRGLTRHGNIGVTTSQQMLLSEVDLRTKTIFTDIVLKDVDSMLCLMVY